MVSKVSSGSVTPDFLVLSYCLAKPRCLFCGRVLAFLSDRIPM